MPYAKTAVQRCNCGIATVERRRHKEALSCTPLRDYTALADGQCHATALVMHLHVTECKGHEGVTRHRHIHVAGHQKPLRTHLLTKHEGQTYLGWETDQELAGLRQATAKGLG